MCCDETMNNSLSCAGWPVAIGETPSNRQEAVAAGIR